MSFCANLRLSVTRILQILTLVLFSLAAFSKNISSEPKMAGIVSGEKISLYDKLHLASLGLKKEVLEKALVGYKKLSEEDLLNGSNIISIADFTQSSNAKRLYIIDVVKGELLLQTWVAHGRNSGDEFANSFSNDPHSLKSSLGFYVTGSTYMGAHGLSLRINGLEKGINDNAERRAIVIHGASYVSESFIKQTGRLGRSFGCPAVNDKLSNQIIDLIKDGTCFYIYH